MRHCGGKTRSQCTLVVITFSTDGAIRDDWAISVALVSPATTLNAIATGD